MNYRADIDGLRAIAVIGVILFHADLGISGGYTGVDVFFVISGYLITGIILKDLRDGNFSILNFWERRARRILPALFAVVLVTLIMGWFLLLPEGYKSLGTSILYLSSFASNIYFWQKSSGYFNGPAEELPLLHTWSLSLEEQFYLIIPFVLLVLFRTGLSHRVFLLIASGALVSFALSIFATTNYPGANFFLLPTRAWELAAGSMIAFAKPIKNKNTRIALNWIGILSIGIPYFFYNHTTPFPGLAALPPVAGTVFLIWTGMKDCHSQPHLLIHRLLSLKPMVFIGLLSYSLYLWHWPLLAFNEYIIIWKDSLPFKGLLLGASVIISWLSLRFIERPFRSQSLIRSRTVIFILSGLSICFLSIPSYFILNTEGAQQRFPGKSEIGTTNTLTLGNSKISDIPDNLIHIGKKDEQCLFLLLGDSHAKSIIPTLTVIANNQSISGKAWVKNGWHPLLYDNKHKFRTIREISLEISSFLKNDSAKKSFPHIILAGRWWTYVNGSNDHYDLAHEMKYTINMLLKEGYTVSILKQVPQFTDSEVIDLMRWYTYRFDRSTLSWKQRENFPSMPEDELRSRFIKQNAIFEQLTMRFPGVRFLDPLPYLKNNEGVFVPTDEYGDLYRDDDHLSKYGALRIKPLFEFLRDLRK